LQVLFGLFGAARSFDGFDYGIILINVRRGGRFRRRFRVVHDFFDGEFLINVNRGRGFRAVHEFFDDSDLGILVLFLATLSLHSAVDNNGQDKEHPEENSNSAAKDEGDSSTFPTTQIHDGVMNAINERSFAKVVVTSVVAVTAMGVGMAVVSMVGRTIM